MTNKILIILSILLLIVTQVCLNYQLKEVDKKISSLESMFRVYTETYGLDVNTKMPDSKTIKSIKDSVDYE